MEMLLNNMDLINLLEATTLTQACNEVPQGVVNIVHLIIMLIQVVAPILLIIWGMLDFAKAVIGGDEDKIKAGQKTFIKRLIAAVILFLVVTIVKLLVNLVGVVTKDTSDVGAQSTGNIWGCVDRFLNGSTTAKAK